MTIPPGGLWKRRNRGHSSREGGGGGGERKGGEHRGAEAGGDRWHAVRLPAGGEVGAEELVVNDPDLPRPNRYRRISVKAGEACTLADRATSRKGRAMPTEATEGGGRGWERQGEGERAVGREGERVRERPLRW
jgi:hypothetical protein